MSGEQATPEAAEIPVRPGRPTSKRIRTGPRRAYKAVVGALGVAAMRCIAFALPFEWAAKLGRFAGHVAWFVSPRDRAQALANLKTAFPEKSVEDRRRIARESFARVGESVLEWIAVRRIEKEIGSRVEIVGQEHLAAARERGNGLIWITGHVCNWELMAAAVSRAGNPCSVIATTVRYAALNRHSIAARGKYGIRTIERESPSSARELLRLFRANELIGILSDHDTKVPSVQVDFFGKKAWTPVGPAELAVRIGIPVVTGFMERTAPGRWRVVLSPPMFPPEKTPKSRALEVARDITQAYTLALETHLRVHPEDWAWMHERWKP